MTLNFVIGCQYQNHQKNKIMERKLGEVFEYNNVKLQVIEQKDGFSCNDCYFLNGIDCNEQLCLRMDRHDRKSVIFKEIK